MKIQVSRQIFEEQEIELTLPAYFKDKDSACLVGIQENGDVVRVRRGMIVLYEKDVSNFYVNDLKEVVSSWIPATAEDFNRAFENTLAALGAAADRLVSISAFPEPADYQTV